MPTAPKKSNSEDVSAQLEPAPESEHTVIPDKNAFAGEIIEEPLRPVGHVPAPFAEPEPDPRKEVSAPFAGVIEEKAELTPNYPPPPIDAGKMYTEGNWAGHTNYECKLCPYSTLEKENVLAHIIERHSGVESTVVKKTHS